MKKAKVISIIALVILSVFSFVSCSMTLTGESAMDGGGFHSPSGSFKGDYDMSEDAAPSGSEADDTAEGEVENKPEEVQRPAGLITASAWNDNDYFDLYRKLFEQGSENEGSGKFFGFENWGFSTYDRIKVTVVCGENKVAGAEVVAVSNDGEEYKAVTDSNGVAYIFAENTNGQITVSSGEYTANAEYTKDSDEITVELSGYAEKKNKIELMFVVDVTGSMGDELSYLKNEIADVVSRVAANDSTAEISLALLFYRDLDDKEQFKYHDFVNVSAADGIKTVISYIDAQKATGGGDYPEAVDEALEMAVNAQWSSGATTKIIFQILDAPPHNNDENKTCFNSAVSVAAEKGIRICPILCSGADTRTEYVMREAAVMTAGTFIFVTDDSGIGGAHHDPDIPNATVEALNSLLVRVINGYYTGTFADPVDWRQEIK